MGIVSDLVYIVVAALVGGFLAHLLRQPVIIGYIAAGVVVGPHTGGLTVKEMHDIEKLAEIGVALLLFTLGLEFSLGELRRIAGIALLGTPIQLALSSCLGYGVSRAMGLSLQDSLWMGGIVSLSSTMVVLKSLAARDALGSVPGRIMLGMLIAQDLAVIPLMLVLPQITDEHPQFASVGAALLKSVSFLAVMYVVGTKLFPWMFARIARVGSRELFLLCTLAVALGTGAATHELELSFAFGAFIAGILLSETDFNHQALSDVASLRDLFGLLFFVSVGMLFDPHFFLDHVRVVLVLVLVLVIFKAILTGAVVRLFGYGGTTPWIVGLGLSQIGEFAFLLAGSGIKSGKLSAETYSLVISVTAVSMMVTPGLLWLAPRLYTLWTKSLTSRTRAQETEAADAEQHVVIIGAGTVGLYAARVLASLDYPHVVVELDHKVVTQLRDQGARVIFGDATHRAILEAAGLERARLVIVATTSDAMLERLVRQIRAINASVPLVVRVQDLEHAADLTGLGVHELVHPQREAGLEMVHQSLLALGVDQGRTHELIDRLRSERYSVSASRAFIAGHP